MKLLLVAVCIVSVIVSSDACSCAFEGDPADIAHDQFCSATFVLKGTVVSDRLEPTTRKPLDKYIKDRSKAEKKAGLREYPYTIYDYIDDVIYQVDVNTVLKGDVEPGMIDIYTAAHDATCGAFFAKNVEYIIYAGYNYKGKMKTGLCRGNHPAEYTDMDMLKGFQCDKPSPPTEETPEVTEEEIPDLPEEENLDLPEEEIPDLREKQFPGLPESTDEENKR